jgi:hypothetical protein
VIIVKEAQVMSDNQEQIFSYDSFKRKMQLIRSLEKYSSKLDKLIEKTSNIEQLSLKAGK